MLLGLVQMQDADDVDFGGFRTILLYPRHKPEYPPHGAYERTKDPPPSGLGGSKPPLPDLMTKGTKPVAAATIRVGLGYIEIPFFATGDSHRGKGYCRCLLESIEQVPPPNRGKHSPQRPVCPQTRGKHSLGCDLNHIH